MKTKQIFLKISAIILFVFFIMSSLPLMAMAEDTMSIASFDQSVSDSLSFNGLQVWDGTIATSFDGGSGTASNPYRIANAQQLAYLAQQVNGGTDYSGQYFRQTEDITLNEYNVFVRTCIQ
ncbi:hypothetical protein [Candidatus Bathycorpusculum sp.]|uniref:hypothetical protein n=1 Tax=Candidatus Bathycorpusculum sp. TaxID=2994959 RepID=UPI00282FC9C2|nr:hypothetical protein [Candidatus Termitimicrobium sp.]